MSLVKDIQVLEKPSVQNIDLISELAYNVFYGNVPLTKEEITFLKPYKNQLEILVSKTTKKRRLAAITTDLLNVLKEASLRHLDG